MPKPETPAVASSKLKRVRLWKVWLAKWRIQNGKYGAAAIDTAAKQTHWALAQSR